MSEFVHQRHTPPSTLPIECDVVVACPPLRSNVNLARIVRAASCSGVRRMVVCGRPRIDERIARQGTAQVTIESHRTLPPILKRLKEQGYQLVGLEQAAGAQCLYHFSFQPRTVLVPGNEREGLDAEILRILDRVVEIPVFGLPYSHNVATATAMALYEYCRQLGGL